MNVDELMVERAWVHRLARALLKDSDAAEDVAQDAWLVAAEHAPDDGRPLRPWLHRVVVNLVRMRGRSAARRVARERATGEVVPDVPTSAELVERLETERALGAEVIALAEPYRSTVLLHYVEGLSSADIARRLDIPSATVRRRLKVALARLRERLSTRDDAPNKSWLAALVPLARAQPTRALGVVAMKKLIAVIVVVLVLLLGFVGVARWRRGSPNAEATPTAVTPASAMLAAFEPRQALVIHGQPVPWDWLAQAGIAPKRVAGHVTFAGKPVAGATVRLGAMLGDLRRHVPEMTGGPAIDQLAVRTTDAAGGFDFGTLPAANLVVSAEAVGKSPASVSVAMADPGAAPPSDRLVIALGDCSSRLYGTVRDSAGPIARARIRIAALGGVDADAAGAYSLCVPRIPFPNVRIEADGYGSVNIEIPPLYGDLKRDFVLAPEAIAAGTVVDDAGQPVPSAIVTARPLLSDGRHEVAGMTTVSDAAGNFQLGGLAPAKWQLGAFAGRLACETNPLFVATAGGVTRDLRIVISRRARVTGHVMMAGKPVAGALVGTNRSTLSGRSPITADSQVDGSFVLDGVALGTLVFDVKPYTVVSPVSLVVDRTEVADITIEVAPKASLHGVVTRHHVPVAGARIEFSIDRSAMARSDAAGAYELEGLPAGSGVVTAQDLKAFTNHPITLVAGQAQQLDLELEGGGEVHGIVVDERGQPVPSVYVHFESTDHSDGCNSLTDAAGVFECATLAGHLDYRPSVYPSIAQLQPFRSASGTALALVHVDDGDALVTGIRLAIALERLSIRGTVVDDRGAPVSDAHVTVGSRGEWGEATKVRADADGGFVIDDLAPGRYNVQAHAPDGSEGSTQVAAGTTTAVIALVRPGRVEGTLVGFTAPPHVLAEQPTNGYGDLHDAIVTGDRFTFPGLPTGTYTVDAIVDGVQVDGTAVDVKPGKTAQIMLRTRPRATVDGRITDHATGAPIAGMTCDATVSIDGNQGPLTGRLLLSTATGAAGTFSVDAPVGRVRVHCVAPGTAYAECGGDYDVSETAPNHIEITAVKQVPPASETGFLLAPWHVPPIITSVDPDAKTGLAVGDRIVAVDGIATTNMIPDGVEALAQNHPAGSTVVIQVVRGGQPLTLHVPLH